jgi:hypothetical protein
LVSVTIIDHSDDLLVTVTMVNVMLTLVRVKSLVNV